MLLYIDRQHLPILLETITRAQITFYITKLFYVEVTQFVIKKYIYIFCQNSVPKKYFPSPFCTDGGKIVVVCVWCTYTLVTNPAHISQIQSLFSFVSNDRGEAGDIVSRIDSHCATFPQRNIYERKNVEKMWKKLYNKNK